MDLKEGLTYHGDGPDRILIRVGDNKVLYKEIYRSPKTRGPYRMKSTKDFQDWAQGIVVGEETDNA